jgi:hypothetical protein
MSGAEKLTEFEQVARDALEASVTRVDARVRSRLNQGRQAAVDELLRRRGRRPFWRGLFLVPTVGAVAAALIAVMLIGYSPRQSVEQPPGLRMDDLDLLADADGLDLIQSDGAQGDGAQGDGAFYEWAMAQADGGEAAGTGT